MSGKPQPTDVPESFRDVDTLILDMDGVVTSEESYFDAAGLTIREILESPLYLGLSPSDYTSIPEVFYRHMAGASRNEWRKYLPSELIVRCKNRGVSTNWDLAYLVAGIYMAPLFVKSLYPLAAPKEPENEPSDHGQWEYTERFAIQAKEPFDEKEVRDGLGALADVYRRASLRKDWSTSLRASDFMEWGRFFRSRGIEIALQKGIELKLFDDFHPQTRGLELLDKIHESVPELGKGFGGLFGRETLLWTDMQNLFQEWYLGEELYAKQMRRPVSAWPKPGLIHQEEPLLPEDRTRAALGMLRENGFTLGIATGRPKLEILSPLERWGMDRFFNPKRIATHDDIETAQKALVRHRISEPLSKPHPFVFLQAIHPTLPPLSLYKGRYDSHQHQRFAVVGDTVADIWAAKKIGCPTIAVLSGAAGVLGQRYLEQAQPDLVVKDLEELATMFSRKR
ncbi:MAG: HAD hydrolase-like protein [bacterium]